MKRAFTLIELLVVIAIIAILAAILFPVFAQAKIAAKKTAAISGQKQVSLGLLMYLGDSDDTYPRGDDCVPGSSLNPDLNRPGAFAGNGCSGPFPWSVNSYTWQKWVLPYTKNVTIFEHPGRQKIDQVSLPSVPYRQWSESGEIMGGYALNLALTGSTSTWNRAANAVGRYRNSWLGGTHTAIPDPAAAMILFEFAHPRINFSPALFDQPQNSLVTQTIYPTAIREFWARWLLKWDVCTGPNMSDFKNEPSAVAFGGGITIGYADGSAKFLSSQRFLAQTPTATEYGVTLPAGNVCGNASSGMAVSTVPNLNIHYPLWGLQQ